MNYMDYYIEQPGYYNKEIEYGLVNNGINGYSYGNYGYNKKTSWLDNFSFTSTYESYKEKKARVKEIKKYIDDNLKSKYRIKAQIGGANSVSRKRNWFHIQVSNNKDYKKNITEIEKKLEIYQNYPILNKIDNYLSNFIKELVDFDFVVKEGYNDGYDFEEIFDILIPRILSLYTNNSTPEDKKNKILKLFKNHLKNDIKNIETIKNIYNNIDKKIIVCDDTNWGGVDLYSDKGKEINRKKSKIQIQIPENQIIKEPDLYRGRRINPQYIKGVDYRVLQNKHIVKPEKTSLLILIDGSGSMSGGPYEDSINFAKDLMELGVFDIEVLHTTDKRLKDITKELEKWNGGHITKTGGAEGFEYLTDRYPKQITQDYILVFTDMDVPNDAEDNLREFVKGKKHLILNFGSTKSFQGLHTRQIKTTKDMKNVVSTLFHNN